MTCIGDGEVSVVPVCGMTKLTQISEGEAARNNVVISAGKQLTGFLLFEIYMYRNGRDVD